MLCSPCCSPGRPDLRPPRPLSLLHTHTRSRSSHPPSDFRLPSSVVAGPPSRVLLFFVASIPPFALRFFSFSFLRPLPLTYSAASAGGAYRPSAVLPAARAEFIIQAYGTVLAPLPGGASEQGNLSRALGSVVGAACLRAEGGVGPQLTSHVFVLLKARHAPGLSVEDYWLASDEGTEWVVRTVDALLDVVKPELGETETKAKL